MKYYLIHGFGRALDLFDREIPVNMGFHIFDEEIKTGQAKVFDWAERIKRNFWSPYNPFEQVKLYGDEKKRAEDKIVQSQLYNDLQKNNPEIVVCHSLGCRLFLNTIKNFGFVDSIKKVVFISADLPSNQKFEDLKSKWINFYCWWDNALLASAFLNFYLPMGSVGAEDKKVKNIFYKLTKGVNPHQQTLRDKNFKARLFAEIENDN